MRGIHCKLITVFLLFLLLVATRGIEGGDATIVVSCDDLSDPGNPPVKTDWRQGLKYFPPDYFDYDTESYLVQTQTIHGTTVLVAIHESLVGISDIQGFPVSTPQGFANFVFRVFHRYWHVFNGFVYDRYIVKVNALSDPQTFTGASLVGLIVGAINSTITNYPPHHYVIAMAQEFVPHELFHAWNGGIIEYVPSGDQRLMQLETWINEGMTVYYSAWVQGIVLDLPAYRSTMKSKWDTYESMVGTEFDLSIEELTFKIGTADTVPPPPSAYTDMLYARSTMLNYMLDLELTNSGASLDSLMRYLYENYGLTGNRWKQEDIPLALQSLVGQTFNTFFNTYLYTNTLLPLDGSFQFLKRDDFCLDLLIAPDIKANGSDGPVNINSTNNLSVTVSLDPGNSYGVDADWWLVTDTSFGWYYYSNVGGLWSWLPGFSVTYQGPSANLASTEALNISNLSSGTYTFYFAVDTSMNSLVDASQLHYDSVVVNVTE